MKKIRVAMLANDMNINGISTVMVNYCTRLDKTFFDVYIITGKPINKKYIDLCSEKQVKLIELPNRKSSKLKYYSALWKTLKNPFDIVHVHGNSSTISIELLLAKLRGVKIRIAHSHNTTCGHMKSHKMLRPVFRQVYTHGLACGQLAGEWLFGGDDFYILPNGFDTKRFCYDSTNRDEIREKLKLSDNSFLIGHIGRFNEQKNHQFLLKLFETIGEKDKDAYLLLIGNGPNYEKVMDLIYNHPYKDRIIVYGETAMPEKMYSAMDVFVLPSKHEGLGIVLLEAQINGLKSVASTKVPSEVRITENVTFVDLEEKSEVWLREIYNCKVPNRSTIYELNKEAFERYDINKSVKYLEELYLKFCES